MTEALPEPATAPPLPMARAAGHPWAWHQVFAPGGYEWWHFDAVSDDGETLLAADFFDGDPFDAEYRRRYERFVRRPTRTAPPLPAEYRGVSLGIFRNGKRIGGFHSRVPGVDFEASGERPFVRLGASMFEGDAAGGCRLELEGDRLQASLSFAPTSGGAAGGAASGATAVHAFPPRGLMGADHWWSPGMAVNRVTGRIEVGGASADFAGRGWIDHLHGMGPLDGGLARWARGRVLGEEGCVAFMSAQGRGVGGQEVKLVVRGTGGVQSTASPLREGVQPGTKRIELGELTLVNPRTLERTGSRLRLLYEVEGSGDERAGGALCDIFTPRRRRMLGGLGF